ncbi:hypothetical protein PR048_032932 [Dryococelus australis]|uniref:Zinc finger PHD-type domain-containing protein n=1 Tax=Dryococelus australis TaxID=614101 RepID=A0ABQ9G3L9_9NEOP|nr:hypothetical protein PR048_032932 [Dryococelus australis]
MQKDLFKWFQRFIAFTESDPVLLLLATHTKSLELIEMAPNQVEKLYDAAFMKAASMETAVNGSRRTIIFPLMLMSSQTGCFNQMQQLTYLHTGLQNPVEIRKATTAVLMDSPYKNELIMNQSTSSKPSKRKSKYESTSRNCSTKRKKKEDIEKSVPTVTSRVSDDDDDDDADDIPCSYCAEKFSASKSAESWAQCLNCLSWSHEECAGVDTDDRGPFECDFCQFAI